MSNNLIFKKSHKGFKYLKTERMNTIASLSFLIDNNLMDSVVCVDVPIFFHVKTNKFCVFLTDQFLEDLKAKELNTNLKYNNCILAEEDKEYLFLSFDSLENLRKTISEQTGEFYEIKTQYDLYREDLTSGKEVILVCFRTEESSSGFSKVYSKLSCDETIKDVIQGITTEFEYFKAIKFNSRYYLLDENNKINSETVFNLEKDQKANMNFLVIPYSQEDWNLVVNINNRIAKIKDKISGFFGRAKVEDVIDLNLEKNNPLLEFKKLKI